MQHTSNAGKILSEDTRIFEHFEKNILNCFAVETQYSSHRIYMTHAIESLFFIALRRARER